MAKLIVKTGKGFSKEEAAVNAGVEISTVKYDSSVAYKKVGTEDGFDLETFAREQIKNRAKDVAGVVFSITKVSGKADTRERPYDEEVVITTQARKYKTIYALITGSKELLNGTVVGTAEDKSSARKAAKTFVSENKVDVTILPIKVVSEGEAVAAFVTYTPSLGTTQGEYVFFSLED